MPHVNSASPASTLRTWWYKTLLLTLLIIGGFALGANAQTVTIPAANTNTASDRHPLGNWWGYERTDALFTAAEIGLSGPVTAIGFYVNSLTSPAASTPVVIKMKLTSNTTVTASPYATASSGATTVFTGNVNSASLTANGWVTLDLDIPFDYTGGTNNLEIFVEANGGGTGIEGQFAKQFRFSAPSPAATRCQLWNGDNSAPTGNGTTNANRPNIQITITPPPPCTGTPEAGTIPSSMQLCTGNLGTLSTTGTSQAAGLSFQWQESPNGATNWVNATGTSTNASYTTAPYSADIHYRLIVTCDASALSDTTNVAAVEAGLSPLDSQQEVEIVVSSCGGHALAGEALGGVVVLSTHVQGRPSDNGHVLVGMSLSDA